MAPASLSPLLSFSDIDGKDNDQFGESVALSETEALVGAPGVNNSGGAANDSGAAYLYGSSGQLLQTFHDPNGSANDYFGGSVALSSTSYLMGAAGVSSGAGAVYLYSSSGQTTIADPNAVSNDHFGISVALSGSNLLVGASGVNNSGGTANGSGAAYLYNTSGTLEHIFHDPNGAGGDNFGCSVALSGTNVLIGAYGVNGSAGAVYEYSTSGTPLETFQDPNGTGSDRFGFAVALSGNTALVGAYGVNNFTGAAYLFSTSTGQRLQTFTDPNTTSGDKFGVAVTFSGNNPVVGAPGVGNSAGAGYVLSPSGQLLQAFQDPNATNGDFFASALAASANQVLSGAGAFINGSAGASYLYEIPSAVSALIGNNGSTAAGTAFGTLLEAQVSDALGNLVAGCPVTFTINTGPNGAGATFAGLGTMVLTNGQGLAIAPLLTANDIAGSFTVTAQEGALSTTFELTNLAGPAGKLVFADVPTSVVAGQPFHFQLDVQDQYGNLATSDSSLVTATLAGGSSTYQASGGVATFSNAFVDTAGGYTLGATDGSLSASTSLTVVAGTPSQVDPAAGTPQSSTVGRPYSTNLAVLVTDAYGNPVSGVSVTFAAPPSGATGTFTGSATVTTGSNGVATAPAFTANTTTGSFTITAFSAAFQLTNVAGPAAKLAFANVPAPATAGNAFGYQVDVEDQYGNLATSDSSDVTATLAGAHGSVQASGGVASFSNAFVDTAGVYTLGATDNNLSVNTSLTVQAAAPSQIAPAAGTPQSTTVGKVYSTNLAVLITDAFGNPESGVTVTFAAPANGAGGSFGGSFSVTTASNGVATAPAFTANTTAGGFTVTASFTASSSNSTSASTSASSGSASTSTSVATANASAVVLTTLFDLDNLADSPAYFAPYLGTPPSATVGTAFAALEVLVTDSYGNPVSGATVGCAVTAGSNGATGSLAGSTAVTNAAGVASLPTLTAGQVAGSFTVTAAGAGAGGPPSFLYTYFSMTSTAASAAIITAPGGALQNTPIGFAYGSLLQARVTDGFGNPLANVPVTFSAPQLGPTGLFNGLTTVPTNDLGIATAPAFSANHTPGSFTVTATAAGIAAPATFTLTNTTIPAAVKVASAYSKLVPLTSQNAIVGTNFAQPLQAIVTDASGRPVSGITVDFEVPGSGPGGTFASLAPFVTNAAGVATAPVLTANTVAGSFTVNAWVVGVAKPAAFKLTNLAAFAADPVGGPAQSATVGHPYGQRLQARVSDAFGNAVGGVTVTFTAPATGAGGTFAGKKTVTAVTAADGVATAPAFTANTRAGSFVVSVSAPGVPAGTIALTNLAGPAALVRAIAGTPQSATIHTIFATALEVKVTDAFGNAVSGVAVTFTVQPIAGAGATLNGGTVVTEITNGSGEATAPALVANGRAGAFEVRSSAAHLKEEATFKLTNVL